MKPNKTNDDDDDNEEKKLNTHEKSTTVYVYVLERIESVRNVFFFFMKIT